MDKYLYALEQMLSPVGPDAFFTDYWEQGPLLVSRSDPSYFEGLFSLDALDQILARADLWYPSIRVFLNGRQVPPREFTGKWSYGFHNFDQIIDVNKIYDFYRAGATLNIQALERCWAPLMMLNKGLEQQTGFPVHTTAFLTPRSAENIPPHHDAVDFFTLQVGGKKRWRVWRNPQPLPLISPVYPSKQNKGTVSNAEGVRDEDLVGEYLLTDGDTLYVPRGFIHEAVTSDSYSLHVTVGINVHRWFDVLSDAARFALARLGEDEEYRKALPTPAAFSSPGAAETANRIFTKMLDEFRRHFQLSHGYRLVDKALLNGRHPSRMGQLEDIERLPELTVSSTVRRRDGIPYSLTREDDSVVLRFHSKDIAFSGWAEEALQFITLSPSFTVRRIPGLSDASKLTLVSRLISEGFLTWGEPVPEAVAEETELRATPAVKQVGQPRLSSTLEPLKGGL